MQRRVDRSELPGGEGHGEQPVRFVPAVSSAAVISFGRLGGPGR